MSQNAKQAKPKRWKMWAILRDGEFYFGPIGYKPLPELGEKRVRVEMKIIRDETKLKRYGKAKRKTP